MDWTARIRSAFADAPRIPDDDVIAELAQHAGALYEAARAEGVDRAAAVERVDRQIAIWVREAASLTRRPRAPGAVAPPPVEGSSHWAGLLQDIRYALRLWRRAPGAATIAAATIALGIGATTALFSLTWGVLMKPLSWPHADRIVRLTETRGGNAPRFGSFSNTAYAAWRDDAKTIDGLAAWSERMMTLSGDGEPERLRVTTASASVFEVLGAYPRLGSVYREQDEAAAVVVLAESLWRDRFGADPSAIGRSLRLDGDPYTIVGVLPDAFAFPNRRARAWIPLRVPPPSTNALTMFDAVARLSPGATPAHAAAEGTARGRFAVDTGMTTMAIFGSTGEIGIAAEPLRDALTADVRAPLLILLAAVGLLLVTATGNVASIQLARAAARRREMAIRAAIGAGASRLTRQLLVESVLLGTAGGAAGLALAWVLHRAIPALLPVDFPRVQEVGVTLSVVAFATAATVVTSIAIGVLPAFAVRRMNVTEALVAGGATLKGGGARTARVRTLITGAQVAMACVLLVGASLLGRSFVALVYADRGYDPDGVLTARLSLPDSRYSPERRYTVVEQLLDRVSAMPDVAAAAFTSELPLTPGGSTAAFTMRSRALEAGTISVQASPRIVSPQSFGALGLRVVAGRGFMDSDTDASPPAAIVNRAFSRRYAADAALGAQVPMAVGYGMEGLEATVVGVIEDVQYPGTRRDPQPEIYYSFRQLRGELKVPVVTFLLRTYGDPQRAAADVRAAIHLVDPTLAPDLIATLEDRVLTTLARPRLYAAVLGGFGVFALVIAGVGLFGVLSYSVAQRSHELGIRAALGASPARIVSMVVGNGLLVATAGALIGVFAALLLVRALAAFLYGVAPYDAVTFVLVPMLLMAVAALACVVPARRAARVDPVRVLRAG